MDIEGTHSAPRLLLLLNRVPSRSADKLDTTRMQRVSYLPLYDMHLIIQLGSRCLRCNKARRDRFVRRWEVRNRSYSARPRLY